MDSNYHGENPPQGPQLRDLQGNIVATASLSATETKLLSTYNSTEFGVPSGKTATPTYAWLGATGLSSQLPSGTITQDGATYVPQTGRQLQTQPFDLPAPSKSIPAFTDAAPPGAAEEAAAAASIQETQYLEAKRAEELAANPPGAVPTSGCNEEIEGCGPDPESGNDEAACGAWVSWKHSFNNELGVNAHFVCNYDVNFEMQIALLLVVGPEKYHMEYFSKKVFPASEVTEWGCGTRTL